MADSGPRLQPSESDGCRAEARRAKAGSHGDGATPNPWHSLKLVLAQETLWVS
jgi:hypothetical protein